VSRTNAASRPTWFRLLNEAIAADSNFGAAYISLVSDNTNRRVKLAETARLLTKVHELRSRLGDRDRLTSESYYYEFGPVGDRDPARTRMYEDSLYIRFTTGPFGALSRNHAALVASYRGDYARTDSLLRVASALDPAAFYPVGNQFRFRLEAGRFAAAESSFRFIQQRFPAAQVKEMQLWQFLARKQFAAADSAGRLELAAAGTNAFRRAGTSEILVALAEERGALSDAEHFLGVIASAEKSRGVVTADLTAAARRATNLASARGDTIGALRALDSALARTPLESVPDLDRPHVVLARAFAVLRRPDRARPYLAALERQRMEGERYGYLLAITRADVAMAERRWDDALAALPDSLGGECRPCIALARGMAYDGRDRGLGDPFIRAVRHRARRGRYGTSADTAAPRRAIRGEGECIRCSHMVSAVR
jgi:tetratricopeptide (TPR) repeat protein